MVGGNTQSISGSNSSTGGIEVAPVVCRQGLPELFTVLLADIVHAVSRFGPVRPRVGAMEGSKRRTIDLLPTASAAFTRHSSCSASSPASPCFSTIQKCGAFRDHRFDARWRCVRVLRQSGFPASGPPRHSRPDSRTPLSAVRTPALALRNPATGWPLSIHFALRSLRPADPPLVVGDALLLRHRLLRQPGGFEGVVAVHVLDHMGGLAVAHRVDVCQLHLPIGTPLAAP